MFVAPKGRSLSLLSGGVVSRDRNTRTEYMSSWLPNIRRRLDTIDEDSKCAHELASYQMQRVSGGGGGEGEPSVRPGRNQTIKREKKIPAHHATEVVGNLEWIFDAKQGARRH